METERLLEFLRAHGFSAVELALEKDIRDGAAPLDSCDLERFRFPMNPPLPPLRIQPTGSRRERGKDHSGSESGADCSDDEEFVSLGSSTSGAYNSDFINPYARHFTAQADSDASSDRLSQFGTAREYHGFDIQTNLWYDDKEENYYLTPHVTGFDPFGGPSEDKFVMTSEISNQSKDQYGNQGTEDEQNDLKFQFSRRSSSDDVKFDKLDDYFHLDGSSHLESDKIHLKGDASSVFTGEEYAIIDSQSGGGMELFSSHPEKKKSESEFSGFRSLPQETVGECAVSEKRKSVEASEVITGIDEHDAKTQEELSFLNATAEEYEVFNLRIIHRKNRTGFEENKELPIVLNSVIAGRYYVTEYLGSAAFSRVVQAHDIETGVDVCLKIIKNDKDFFDQSLDEIKLLKYVNKQDPGDEHHILRLYDYFYHQEHLFIVCELLKANLYEFQKYNLETGGEPYFTLDKLQAITRHCLEALDFLHDLGIIHCDLKPENILIKSYTRCEVKVIDLGSSCFLTDNLSLYVQSRSYRAPEVILGLPYGPKIDIWSLGCILAELCTGEVLFPNESAVMILARMIALVGPFSLEMLFRGKETPKYFTKEFDLYYINEDTDQPEYITPEMSSLEEHLSVSDSEFIDFVKHLLQVNPKRRPTAKDALKHPWLLHEY